MASSVLWSRLYFLVMSAPSSAVAQTGTNYSMTRRRPGAHSPTPSTSGFNPTSSINFKAFTVVATPGRIL